MRCQHDYRAFPDRICKREGGADGFCFWHSRLKGKKVTRDTIGEDRDLAEAYLVQANISDVNVAELDLRYSTLSDSVMERCRIVSTLFAGARLAGSRITASDLRSSDIRGCCATGMEVRSVNLDGCRFTGSDLSGSEFISCSLNGADLRRTDLFEVRMESVRTRNWQIDEVDRNEEHGNLPAALRVQGMLRYVAAAAGDGDVVSRRFYREQVLRRRMLFNNSLLSRALRKHNPRLVDPSQTGSTPHLRFDFLFLLSGLFDLVAGYGESLWKVIATGVTVVLACSVMFFFSGVQVHSTASPQDEEVGTIGSAIVDYDLSLDWSNASASQLKVKLRDLGTCIYLSGVTFSTLGYGDVTPTGRSRPVATVEACAGVFLFALTLFTVGRKVYR